MGKQQKMHYDTDAKANKGHKTLRDKLRKRREQQKQHKKEKSEKKKQYDALYEKSQYFSKGENKNESKQLKMKKIIKHIEKFINIYEDDLNDFYDMFGVLDKGGKVDISALENKAMMKCLKKMFKYLPLKKQNGQYVKNENTGLNLQVMMKEKVSECIEYYLENGSRKADSDESSGEQKPQQHKKKEKKQKKEKAVDEEEGHMGPIRLYKNLETPQPEANMVMGPFIPQEEKQKMAQLFEEQLEDLKRQRQQQAVIPQVQPTGQGDEFDQIFSMYQTRKQMKAPAKISQEVPQHLMAQGSARLGQKVEVDQESIDEYNRINRPKKLIDVHKQLMQSRGTEEQPNKRRGFNRQRDVLGQGKTASFMKNSTFFDFKSKMTKPSKTNQFL